MNHLCGWRAFLGVFVLGLGLNGQATELGEWLNERVERSSIEASQIHKTYPRVSRDFVSSPAQPLQYKNRPPFSQLVESADLIQAREARTQYGVNGRGLAVAVIDTGLRTSHVDFVGRVIAEKNFTSDNQGNENDATDEGGHGTNVTGIIAANGIHTGIAPEANIVPLKVLDHNGNGSFQSVKKALDWVIENHKRYQISVVSMSLGTSENLRNSEKDALWQKIATLRYKHRIPTVVAAGNAYFSFSGSEGMAYPAIFGATVSVGAVYDADVGPFSYQSGAKAFSTAPYRITPFSQRLHPTTESWNSTDIFAPGAPVTSSGILGDAGVSVQHGTSQATPMTAGTLLLMQQLYQRHHQGALPEVVDLEIAMMLGGVSAFDGFDDDGDPSDDEDDNVFNTQKSYRVLNALGALDQLGLPKHSDSDLGVNFKVKKFKTKFKFLKDSADEALLVGVLPIVPEEPLLGTSVRIELGDFVYETELNARGRAKLFPSGRLIVTPRKKNWNTKIRFKIKKADLSQLKDSLEISSGDQEEKSLIIPLKITFGTQVFSSFLTVNYRNPKGKTAVLK